MAETDQDPLLGTTIGERLRVAREAKGLSLEDVARQTRIPIRHLEHIERSEWDALPAVTYSVGFARSYATTVGLDGAAIGAELREELGASRSPTGPASYYEPADPARVPPRSVAIVAAILALLLVGGYLYWRSTAVDDGVPEPQVADAPAPVTAPVPQPQTPSPAQATGPVVLTAAEDVWMRVSDGGQTLYEGILTAGQRYQVPAGAQAPTLRAGRGAAVRVSVGNAQIPPIGGPSEVVSNVSLKAADLVARAQGQGQAIIPAPPPTVQR